MKSVFLLKNNVGSLCREVKNQKKNIFFNKNHLRKKYNFIV